MSTEKPKCMLLVEKPLYKSKARRFFYLFKPKEIVVGENYLVGLNIRNEDNIAFNGGKIDVKLFSPYGGGEISYDLTQVIPVVPPKQSRDIWFEPQEAEIAGTAMLSILRIIPIGEDVNIECHNRDGDNMLNSGKVITVQISSREEIYQKYSVVVAIFFSVIAMTVSIINAIASIIGSLLK